MADSCVMTHTDEGLRVAVGDSETCSIVQQTLERLGDKWTLLVVLGLSEGPQRFNALQRTVVGISHRMLSVTLRRLERDGMVARTAPPAVRSRGRHADELEEEGGECLCVCDLLWVCAGGGEEACCCG